MDYRIEIDVESIHRRLGYLLRATNDLRPLMDGIAGILEDEAQSAFKQQKSPKGDGWAKLSEVTIALREKSGHWPGQILQRSGRLAESISSQVTPNSAGVDLCTPDDGGDSSLFISSFIRAKIWYRCSWASCV